MIVDTPARFLEAAAALTPLAAPVTARAAFLIAPAAQALAAESAADNRYMDLGQMLDPVRAREQHMALATALRADLPVMVFPGDPNCPDDVFPNNVFATAPGRLIVGRMRHAVRRREAARADIRRVFGELLGYDEVDLSSCQGLVAELTGSLVIDHARGIGYCGLSERCDMAGARAMHEAFGLRLSFAFPLAEGEYHTNVVLSILAGRAAVIAADGFADAAVPAAIARAVDGRTLWLTPKQKQAFAANVIALSPHRVWMSARAASALTPEQVTQLADWDFAIGQVELGEIEKAGGSLRCCVAEIF
jgi:hypothetical protein